MKICAVLVSVVIALPVPRAEAVEAAKGCAVGVYRFKDGRTVDVASSDDHTLRWMMFTGERGQLHPQPDGSWTSTYGWTGRSDGKKVSFPKCGAGEIIFDHERARRIDFDVHDSPFESGGERLVGRLVMPKAAGKVPVVVLVHGSEHDSALDTYALQRLNPWQGVAAFVYDKRGTGASRGKYTQDFQLKPETRSLRCKLPSSSPARAWDASATREAVKEDG